MVTGAHRPGIGGRPIPGQVIPPKFSNFPKGIGATAPAWVAYDRQVNVENIFVINLPN